MKQSATRHRSRASFAITLVCMLAAIYALRRLHLSKIERASENGGHNSNYQPPTNPPGFQSRYGKQRVHLLIPANQANARMCRTMMSALVNDYPPPTIINWERNVGDHSVNGYDIVTGKNWGMLKYLRNLPPQADKDLVIMVDAYDSIFQLPLEVALQRYEAVNNQARARLVQQHGEEQVLKLGLNQTVIMGAEKFCWPLDHKHPACWAVPPSLIPENAYGGRTDKSTEKNRPRWLNSGTVMGLVGDLRELYEWAHVLWMAYDTDGGDQDYFSNIYGRQELSRQKQRASKEWIFGFGENFPEDELIWPHLETRHIDRHLGLDLASTLFQPLNAAVDDMSPVAHGDAVAVEAKDREHGTASVYNSPFPFPDDLLRAPMPNGSSGDGATKTTWRDVKLFTNFHARSIPAILHYNGGVKSALDKAWPLHWWTGRGRAILRSRMGDAGLEIATDANKTVQWADICGKFEDQLM